MQFRGSSRRLAAAVLSVSVISSLLWMGLGIGLVASPAARAAVSLSPAPSVIINEVNAVNWSGAQDEDGTFQDWAELFNTTTVPVDLTGWGLSNTAKSPFRWVFPTGTSIEAHGYLRVWLSKKDRTTSTASLHTNFNVDAGSDQVVLTAPNLTVTGQAVDSTAPPKTKPDVSWCRMPSGSATAAFTNCLAPTPGAANAGAVAAGLLTTPTLSQPSSVYSGSFSVNAAGPAGATLRYTTDGSEPSVTSTPVTGPITVSASEVLRVGAFAAGMLPSYSQSATYVRTAPGGTPGSGSSSSR